MTISVVSTSAPVDEKTLAVSIPVIGDILDDLSDKVNEVIRQAIEEAEGAMQRLLIQAGRQVSLAIQNAKDAYDDSLQKTKAAVSSVIRETLEQLEGMVKDLQNKTETMLIDMEERAQQIINSFPFVSNKPQLTHVNPRYLVPTTSREPIITCGGNFIDAATKGYEPSLDWEGRSIPPLNTTTQRLDFKIPFDRAKLDQFSFFATTLKVKWEAGWYWWSNKKVSEYKVWIGVLPLSPGKITAIYTASTAEHLIRRFSSGNFHLEGNSLGGGILEKVSMGKGDFTAGPEKGWHVVPGTSHLVVNGTNSQVGSRLTNENDTQVSYEVTIMSISAAKAWADVRIDFDEFHDEAKVSTREEEIDLKWGDSVIIEPKEGEKLSKIILDDIEGTHSEFGGVGDHRFLEIRNLGGNQYRLEAKIPRDF